MKFEHFNTIVVEPDFTLNSKTWANSTQFVPIKQELFLEKKDDEISTVYLREILATQYIEKDEFSSRRDLKNANICFTRYGTHYIFEEQIFKDLYSENNGGLWFKFSYNYSQLTEQSKEDLGYKRINYCKTFELDEKGNCFNHKLPFESALEINYQATEQTLKTIKYFQNLLK